MVAVHVAHVITTLDRAGAESWLARLLPALKARGVNSSVISLRPNGDLEAELADQGIRVESLQVAGHGRSQPVRAFADLRRILQAHAPRLIQGWMYHGNLFGAAAALGSSIPVVWNIRGSMPVGKGVRASTGAIATVGGIVSPLAADAIVYCSHAAVRPHRRLGYRSHLVRVIPNGFNISPRLEKARARQDLGLPLRSFVIGRAARFHPAKDYPTLFAALSQLRRTCADAHLAVCGIGIAGGNTMLRAMIDHYDVADAVTLLGTLQDMDTFYSALDVLVSTSLHEGFPNTLGEAMAAGIPVVSTPAGDSTQILGPGGSIVPKDDPGALVDKLMSMYEAGPDTRRRLGLLAQGHIMQHYSVEAAAVLYASLYRELLHR